MNPTIENNIHVGVTKPMNETRKLGQIILDTLNESPDHVAQIDAETGGQTTCAEMKERSIRCALWMKKLPICPGEVVVVVTHNHLDAYIPFFATFFIDAVFNAWNHGVTLYTARRLMKQFTPKLIFTCEEAVDTLMLAATLQNLSVHLVVFGKHSRARPLHVILDSQTKEEIDEFVIVNERRQEDVAAIMLSSGTAGFPKGVMLSGKSLVSLTARLNKSDPIDKSLWYSTLDWASCISFTLCTLVRRNTRIIPGQDDLVSFFQYIHKYKVTLAFITPILANAIAKYSAQHRYDLSSLKYFVVGGCKIAKQVLKGIKRNVPSAHITQGYGCTEMGVITSRTSKSRNIKSTGFVASNCQIKFVSLESGEALGPNRSGELYVKSPHAMIGYYKDPEATNQAYDEEGWYRTGDIGYYNEAGEIFVDGRIKEIMKYRNHQISPAEIEEVLMSHPEVEDVAVLSIPHQRDGDWPVAFVKIRPGSQVTKTQLLELTSVLEDYKKLRGGIHFIDEMPYTGSGKVAKRELQQLAEQLNQQ